MRNTRLYPALNFLDHPGIRITAESLYVAEKLQIVSVLMVHDAV